MKRFLYVMLMTLLTLTAVIMSVLDMLDSIDMNTSMFLYGLDLGILAIFAMDYFIRLIQSKDKKKFIIENVFDLLAIIPFNSMFRAFRFVRLFRLFRLLRAAVFLKKFNRYISVFLKTNHFIYMVYLCIIVTLLGAISIYSVEKGKTIYDFGDALWWSFVTVTTVGYGDISPSTGIGRWIAAILMLVGIGFIGMLTGTITTFFLRDKKKAKINPSQIIDLSDCSKEAYKAILDYVEYIKSKTN
ncbi:MAG: potassium channel family protein [Clostridia bacterium]|nr:potassium channel family protein [Clostridia bacterium]